MKNRQLVEALADLQQVKTHLQAAATRLTIVRADVGQDTEHNQEIADLVTLIWHNHSLVHRLRDLLKEELQPSRGPHRVHNTVREDPLHSITRTAPCTQHGPRRPSSLLNRRPRQTLIHSRPKRRQRT